MSYSTNTMKSFVCFAFLAISLCVCVANTTAQDTTYYFVPSSQTIAQGGTGSVAVYLDVGSNPCGAYTCYFTYDPAVIAHGESQFILCSACHGPDGRGLPGLGKDMVTSEFIDTLSDEELLAFLIVGRPAWDPTNTTGVDMPPRGGNPALTDDDLRAVATSRIERIAQGRTDASAGSQPAQPPAQAAGGAARKTDDDAPAPATKEPTSQADK